MSLTASEMTPADIAAVTDNNSGGWNGDGSWWLIVLFLFAMMNGGWGNGFGSGGNNGFGWNGAFPWMINNTDNDIQRGFDQSAVMGGINGINAGISGIQQSLCNGFAGVNAGVANGFAQAEIADNARQIANMQQAFNAQTAITQGLTNLSSQFADCCCENRLGVAGLNSTIISENCADREALNNGVRDIIANQTAGIQTILDKMCQQELDAERRENANLRSQLNMANLVQSQTAQTAQILADNARQTTALEQYLNPSPVPAYVVQNPNCCTQNYGCGCGGF